jgi:predicted permease
MTEVLRTMAARVAALFRRRRLDEDLDEELRTHVEMAAERNQKRGMSAEQARREALLGLGGVEQTKQIYREQRGLPMIETTLQDLRYGFRMLWRSPGFSILAILCLTLGIGANAAVFSWMEGILFRPYPAVAHQERLLAVAGTARSETGPTGVSWPDFNDLQKNSTLMETFFVSKITGVTLSIGDRAQSTTGSIVSANYFDAIGVRPILGRGFEPGEDTGRNAHPVTVISYQLWKERYKSDPEIVGKTERLNGVQHTIIGVGPEGFYGTFVGWAMQFWVPASMEEVFEAGGYKLEDRGARWIESFVRLKPGVTLEQAQQEISAVAKRLEADYPETNRGRGIKLWQLWETPFNNAGALLPTLEIMFAVVVFVLLIACANVGNLLIVRSFGRRHEMTVRAAVGAGRGRLLKQLLTEGLLLSVIGAAGGLLVAQWCRRALVLLFPVRGGVSMYLPGELDWRVLALSACVGLVSTLLFGLVPAIQGSKIDLAAALKSEMGGVVGGHGKSWIRLGLVLVQVSLSFVMLVGAGLLLQSLQKIRSGSPGFSTQGVLETYVDLQGAGYDEPRAKTFQDNLIERVQGLPGVESAAFTRLSPLGFRSYSESKIEVDGYQAPPEEQPMVEYIEVSPAYFSTMGIPLVSGREFTRSDNETAAPVAVVNETMAAQYWRGKDPVGDRVQVKGKWRQVVGVAKDSRYRSVRETPMAFFYVPLKQNFSVDAVLIMRTRLGPEKMATALAREMHALDASLAPYELITTQEAVDRSTSRQQVALTLVGVLGGLALLLATVGLYGVMSYVVSQSNRELGLRMALGAGASDVMRLVMSQGLALTAGGVALGAAAALGLTRLLGNMLYKVSPRDPLAFGSACVVLAIATLAACFLPAWRATRTDPARALRN